MEAQRVFRNILSQAFIEKKTRNASYSLRAFSRSLNLNSGIVSSLINGKRNASVHLALRICHDLNLDPASLNLVKKAFSEPYFDESTSSLGFQTGTNVDGSGQQSHVEVEDSTKSQWQSSMRNSHNIPIYSELTIDQFKVISEWHHFAILSLARNTKLKNSPSLLARRLGVSQKAADTAIQTLVRMGLITVEDGYLKRSKLRLNSTDGVQDLAVNRAHQQDCELALKSLSKDSVHERDFSSITFCLNPKDLPKLARKIREFQDQSIETMETPDSQEVYRMSVHLFPLTQVQKHEHDEELPIQNQSHHTLCIDPTKAEVSK